MTHTITTDDLRKTFPSRKGPVEAVRGVSIEVGDGRDLRAARPERGRQDHHLADAHHTAADRSRRARLSPASTSLGNPSRCASASGTSASSAEPTSSPPVGRTWCCRAVSTAPADRGALRGSTSSPSILDLSEFADRRVKTYSGGQRRRLDVALGIVHQPNVLFLDEPTTGLDPQNRANLWDHLRALRDQGTTIVLTTHYLEEADVLCDRLVIVDHGKVVAEGTPAS